MAEKAIVFVSSILNSVGSPFFCSIITNLIEFQQYYAKIKWFLCTQIESVTQNQSSSETKPPDSETSSSEYCNSCRTLISSKKSQTLNSHVGVLRANDIETVMKSLGLGSFCEETEVLHKIGKCRDCVVVDDVSRLLKEKEASLVELKEAFSVFDKNRDGFIDAEELQMVMSGLEFNEGLKVEDCMKMIRAFDEDGDGMIDFNEFKNMLENVM